MNSQAEISVESTDPEVIQRKAEMLTKAVDFGINSNHSIVQKMFDPKAKIVQDYQLNLAKAQLERETQIVNAVGIEEVKILRRAMHEKFNEVIIMLGHHTFRVALEVIEDAIFRKATLEKRVDEIIEDEVDRIAKLKPDQFRKIRETRMYEKIEEIYQTIDQIFDDLNAKIKETGALNPNKTGNRAKIL